ncbi:MAG TPA: zinc ribbon domain-containing protein [Nitrospira sp.]|nr:zinc ribbon domain-containing protein [Nitrospira sp.]
MPIYEYRCLDCRKRSSILQLSLTNAKPISCTHCQSPRLERLMSRFAAPKSEAARLESLSDPDALSGLDKNDPQSMAHFMKRMGDEMGEDLGDDMAEAMEAPDAGGSDLDSSDGL